MIEHKHLIVKGKMDTILGVPQVELFLEELIKLLKMKKMETINPNPNVGYQSGKNGGVTGVAIITTSHLVIHTWDRTKDFQLDVYSCKNYDINKVLNFLNKWDLLEEDYKFFDRKYNIIEEDSDIMPNGDSNE